MEVRLVVKRLLRGGKWYSGLLGNAEVTRGWSCVRWLLSLVQLVTTRSLFCINDGA